MYRYIWDLIGTQPTMAETPVTRRAVLFLAISLFLVSATGEASAADEAGTVSRMRGAATAQSPAETRPLATGDAIYVGDRIDTGADSRLELTLLDGAVMTLGDNSSLLIDRYLVSASGSGSGSLNVLGGVFLAVTGALGKTPGADFNVTTPVATIGVRGTTFWGELQSDGLLVALLDGRAIVVTNPAGQVEINQVGVATRVAAPQQQPDPPFTLTPAQLDAARATVAW
jgi:hypothetical protein